MTDMKKRPIDTFGDPKRVKCLPHLMDEMNKLDDKEHNLFHRMQKIFQQVNQDILCVYSINRSWKQQAAFYQVVCDLLMKKNLQKIEKIQHLYPTILVTLAKNFVVTKFKIAKESSKYYYVPHKIVKHKTKLERIWEIIRE